MKLICEVNEEVRYLEEDNITKIHEIVIKNFMKDDMKSILYPLPNNVTSFELNKLRLRINIIKRETTDKL